VTIRLPWLRSPAQRWIAGLAAAVLAWTLVTAAIDALLPAPSGPNASVYATAADGAAAYGTLLARYGHRVLTLRTAPHAAALDPADTLFLLDPAALAATDVAALRRFVLAGGTLVAGGAEPQVWLDELLAAPPHWDPGATGVATVAPGAAADCRANAVCGVAAVVTAGDGRWLGPGASRAALVGPGGYELLVAALGRGRAELLADTSPLQNRLLATADDAQLALELAGPPARPDVFIESVHGFGAAAGLAAIPSRWRWALIGLLLACAVFVAARARRLGEPDPVGPAPAPERAEYVRALAATLARTPAPAQAAEPVREAALARLEALAGGRADRDPDSLRALARRSGLSDAEFDALRAPAADEAAVLATGRALARLWRLRP